MKQTVERVAMVDVSGKVRDLVLWPRVNALIRTLEEREARHCALVCASTEAFLVGILALMCSGRTAVLPGTPTVACADADTDLLITDRPVHAKDDATIAVPAAGEGGDHRPRPFDDSGEIRFFTSGSSGHPGIVRKSVALLCAEGRAMQATFGPRVQTSMVVATVPLHHRFGFITGVLWPLLAGYPFYAGKCGTPDGLYAALAARRAIIVSSPTFLGSLRELGLALPADRVEAIFSAGAPISDELAAWLHEHCGAAPTEIYGSTEMGGVAWRRWSPETGQMPWQAYPGTQTDIRPGADGQRLHVQAAYTDGWMVADDFVRPVDGGFALLGRVDSVVKVADKRVSLEDMRVKLCTHPWVADARVLLVPAAHPRPGVVAILTAAGQAELARGGRRATVAALRDFLAGRFEPVLLPRKWRFIEDWPDDAMGKVKRQFLLQVLEQPA